MNWLLMTFLCSDPTLTSCSIQKKYYPSKEVCEIQRDIDFLNFSIKEGRKEGDTMVIYCKTTERQAELVNQYYLNEKAKQEFTK